MANQRVIHKADLRAIEKNLSNIHSGIEHMYHYVMSVQNKVQETETKLDQLSNDFYTFLQEELYAKQLQLAETRLVRVRQKLEKEYGHYDDIRRRATGILQAIDVGIVRDEVVTNTTEEFMLSAPKYWLAPCLVALSAWIHDDKEIAEKALHEAFRRNDQKTALFFALIMRRYDRLQASTLWLESYFYLQDVHAIDREVVVLLDSFTNGVFNPQARQLCLRQVEEWYKTVNSLEPDAHKSWEEPLKQFIAPREVAQEYPYLARYSPTFEACKNALEFAHSHQLLLDFLQTVFGGNVQPLQRVHDAVDEMLAHLVTDFDEEELPLRQDDRLLNLIIDENGNKERAQARFQQERSAWEQKFSFRELMKTLAFFPQSVKTTKATQRFALAFCKEWLVHAYKDFTAHHRQAFPTEVEIEIEGWKGRSRDGTNQKELVASLTEHLKKKYKKQGKIKLGKKHIFAIAGGGILSILGFALTPFHIAFLILGILGLAGPGWYLWVRRQNKKAHRLAAEEKKEEAINALLAIIAEIVDWRREYMKADEKGTQVSEFIDSIRKEQYVQAQFDQARAIHTS